MNTSFHMANKLCTRNSKSIVDTTYCISMFMNQEKRMSIVKSICALKTISSLSKFTPNLEYHKFLTRLTCIPCLSIQYKLTLNIQKTRKHGVLQKYLINNEKIVNLDFLANIMSCRIGVFASTDMTKIQY